MTDDYDGEADVWSSVAYAYEAIRERQRNGGPGWIPRMSYRREDLSEAVTIFRGDCAEVLKCCIGGRCHSPGACGSFGYCRQWNMREVAVVTDPPYGIKLNTDNSRFSGGDAASVAKRGSGVGPTNGAPIIGDDEPFDPRPILLGQEQIIFGWHRFPDKLPAGACLVWIKRNDEAFGSFLSDAETAWFSRGHGVYCFRDLSNNGIANLREHPTQKPVSLMRWAIEKTKARTIIDPYMGSGSTGVAAVQMGLGFVGIEKDEHHFSTALRRISRALSEPDLFIEPPPKPKQESFSL